MSHVQSTVVVIFFLEPQVPVSFQVRSRFPLYLFRRLRCAPAPEKDAAAIGAISGAMFSPLLGLQALTGFPQRHHYVSALASLARTCLKQIVFCNTFIVLGIIHRALGKEIIH